MLDVRKLTVWNKNGGFELNYEPSVNEPELVCIPFNLRLVLRRNHLSPPAKPLSNATMRLLQ